MHNDSVMHPRPLHLSWNKLVLPADDPWFKTHYPPNGWGCRCRVTAVSEANARRDGGRFGPAPDDGINPRTGAPNGIDKGFAYMPGDSVTDQVRRTLLAKADKLPPEIGAALAKDIGDIPRLPPPTDIASAEPAALGERVSAAFNLPADGVARTAMDVALPAIDRVQLTLSDINGQPIAHRRFAPEEYLGHLQGSARVEPGQSASIALEVRDPGKQAVAFEFEFH